MQLPGPAVGAPEQVTAALEDRKFILLFPQVDSQGEVERRGDDPALVLEMKSYMRRDVGSGGRVPRFGPDGAALTTYRDVMGF